MVSLVYLCMLSQVNCWGMEWDFPFDGRIQSGVVGVTDTGEGVSIYCYCEGDFVPSAQALEVLRVNCAEMPFLYGEKIPYTMQRRPWVYQETEGEGNYEYLLGPVENIPMLYVAGIRDATRYKIIDSYLDSFGGCMRYEVTPDTNVRWVGCLSKEAGIAYGEENWCSEAVSEGMLYYDSTVNDCIYYGIPGGFQLVDYLEPQGFDAEPAYSPETIDSSCGTCTEMTQGSTYCDGGTDFRTCFKQTCVRYKSSEKNSGKFASIIIEGVLRAWTGKEYQSGEDVMIYEVAAYVVVQKQYWGNRVSGTTPVYKNPGVSNIRLIAEEDYKVPISGIFVAQGFGVGRAWIVGINEQNGTFYKCRAFVPSLTGIPNWSHTKQGLRQQECPASQYFWNPEEIGVIGECEAFILDSVSSEIVLEPEVFVNDLEKPLETEKALEKVEEVTGELSEDDLLNPETIQALVDAFDNSENAQKLTDVKEAVEDVVTEASAVNDKIQEQIDNDTLLGQNVVGEIQGQTGAIQDSITALTGAIQVLDAQESLRNAAEIYAVGTGATNIIYQQQADTQLLRGDIQTFKGEAVNKLEEISTAIGNENTQLQDKINQLKQAVEGIDVSGDIQNLQNDVQNVGTAIGTMSDSISAQIAQGFGDTTSKLGEINGVLENINQGWGQLPQRIGEEVSDGINGVIKEGHREYVSGMEGLVEGFNDEVMGNLSDLTGFNDPGGVSGQWGGVSLPTGNVEDWYITLNILGEEVEFSLMPPEYVMPHLEKIRLIFNVLFTACFMAFCYKMVKEI